jgi:hypothetical protein
VPHEWNIVIGEAAVTLGRNYLSRFAQISTDLSLSLAGK